MAVALSLAVLLIWQLVFKPAPAPHSPESQPQQKYSKPGIQAAPPASVTTQTAQATPQEANPTTELTSGKLEPLPAVTGEISGNKPAGIPASVEVETDLYKCVISTDGGYLKSFLLKKFKETAAKNSPLKELISRDLPPNKSPLLLGLNLGGKALSPTVSYAPDAMKIDLSGKPAGASQYLRMALKTREGFVVERTYSFTNGNYLMGLTVKVSESPDVTGEASSRRVSENASLNWFTRMDEKKSKSRFGTFATVVYAAKGFSKESPSKIRKNGQFTYPQPVWTGFADGYFLDAIIPSGFSGLAVNSVEGEGDDQIIAQRLEFQDGVVAPGQQQVYRADVYIGPKEFDRLKAMGEELNLYRSAEYGYLEEYLRLVTVLVFILKLFNRLVHNWGLSIILLTVLVKVIFFPLTRSSFKQMKAMQALQPRIKELQEKYKNDRAKINEEMMALYRLHKVNPLGGCLPMLLQLPVLYALYRTLYVSIELRYAPFVGWINDLSSPERIFTLPVFGGVDVGIMPILMAVSMYVQQKMTPTTMDPAQAKMFMMMPLMFAFISFGFPSGLVLYWLVSNLLTIAQQYVINRRGT